MNNMELTVREIDEKEYDMWNSLAKESVHGTIFHTTEWLMQCSKFLKGNVHLYACFSGDEMVGGCAIINRGSKAVSNFDVDPYGGLFFKTTERKDVKSREEFERKIVDAFCLAFRKNGLKSVSLTNSPSLEDVRPFIWNGWGAEVFYTYYLDLSGFSEEALSKDARWYVKKATENKVSAEKSDDMDSFYTLLEMTFERHKKKVPIPKDFLTSMVKMLVEKNLGEMWLAKTADGEAVAGEIVVLDEKRAYRWMAASHGDLRKTGAATLLLCKVLENLSGKVKEIDLMGANAPYLSNFVSQFNGNIIPYYKVETYLPMLKIWSRFYKIVRRFYRG